MSHPAAPARLLTACLTLVLMAGGLFAPLAAQGAPSTPADRLSSRLLTSGVTGAAVAQTDDGEPEIGRRDYESPLGYELAWGSDWDLTRNSAAYGFEIALFEPDELDMSLQVWGFMDFAGDPDACLETVPQLYGQLFDVDEIEPVRDNGVDAIGPGDDIAFGTFEYTENPSSSTQRLYIGCQTLVAGESVLVTGVSAEEADFDDSLALADDFLTEGFSFDAPELDFDAFNARMNELSVDIDRFYRRSMRLEDKSYDGPDYETFEEPVATSCVSASTDGSADDTGDQPPGSGPFYCPLDATVLIDAPWLLTYIVPQGGDAVVASILAHESGHHLQTETGWNRDLDARDPKDVFVSEQQADCLSGSYMHSAVLRGIYTGDDIDAVRDIFNSIGGFEEGSDHGTGEERIAAFDLGYDEGFDACGLFDRG